MNRSDLALAGAREIITHCLGLRPNQKLAILFDETAIEITSVFAQAADDMHISCISIFIPQYLQQHISKEPDLSEYIRDTVLSTTGLLTCINADASCIAFRKLILKLFQSARTRIGHMPGATMQVLELANSNRHQVTTDCLKLHFVLMHGKQLELISYAYDGKSHKLCVGLNPFEQMPIVSDGIVIDGAWGNVPSGETYVAPMEGTAEGDIVINGSLHGFIIDPEVDEFVLHFEKGKMKPVESGGNNAISHLLKTQINVAIAQKDPNWSNLAEIGIGVNTAIKHLTGNTLIDEKAAKTAHIAIGSNILMGGNIDSTIHCDMVTLAPTIMIDGKIIMNRGVLTVVEQEWRADYSSVSLPESYQQIRQAVISGVETRILDGKLQACFYSEGRKTYYFVGNDETAVLARKLYKRLPTNGVGISIEDVATLLSWSQDKVKRILYVMSLYGIVSYR